MDSESLMRVIANAILFFIGWVSGGGMLAIATMVVIESVFGSQFNTWFVLGCLWGTFGVWAGKFMVNHLRQIREEANEQ